jgi:hypothetical protein
MNENPCTALDKTSRKGVQHVVSAGCMMCTGVGKEHAWAAMYPSGIALQLRAQSMHVFQASMFSMLLPATTEMALRELISWNPTKRMSGPAQSAVSPQRTGHLSPAETDSVRLQVPMPAMQYLRALSIAATAPSCDYLHAACQHGLPIGREQSWTPS